MKLITLFSLFIILVSFSDCRRNRKDEDKKDGRGKLLLLLAYNAGRNSTLSGSQTTADVLANNNSVSSEDSAESGASGVSSKAFASLAEKAFTTTGSISTSGSFTITDESFDCALGGSITINGKQDFTSTSYTDLYNRSNTITNGTRTITYNNCIVSSSVTINSGTITYTQVTPDSGATTMETKITSGTTSSGTLQRTLTNLSATSKGSMNVTLTGRRGTGTGTIEHDHKIVLNSRVRNWTLTNGRVSKPTLQSRSGSLTGTTTISGTKYTISKSLDVNID